MSIKSNQLKSGVILSYISQAIQLIIGLVYMPLMIRLLGQSEFGLYNIAASVVAYLGVLNLGFGSAYMRFYSRYKETEDRDKVASLNGMFLSIFVVLGIVAIIAGIIVALNVEVIFGPSLNANQLGRAQLMMFILVINLGVSFPNVVFDTYIQANERFVAHSILNILRQVSTPLINLPILLAGYGSVGMVIGITTINVTVEIITMLYCLGKLNMSISFGDFDAELFKEMTTFSFFIFLSMVVDQINKNIDKTVLGRYQGTVSVAIYSVASDLNTYFTTISTSISHVFTPRVHRLEANNESNSVFTDLFIRVGRVQFILLSLVWTGFFFFGQSFIRLWAGSGYETSYYVALILMGTISIPLVQNLGIEIQRAKNKHQFRSWLYIGMAIGNLFITIPLSIRFGAIGAAIGTSLSYIFGNGLIMNWYYYNKIGLNMLKFWKEISTFIPAFILPIIFGSMTTYFFNLYNIWNLIIFGMLYVVVFVISMWSFGMNEYEKNLVKSFFK